jgi:hypothetical protein
LVTVHLSVQAPTTVRRVAHRRGNFMNDWPGAEAVRREVLTETDS